MSVELYTCTPRQVRAFVEEILAAGLVPNVSSSPGMGKSSIMRSVGDSFNLALIDHRVSTSAPEDFTGLPQFVDGKARFAPFSELFPLEDAALPEGKDGWFLFLDEFTAGTKMVQAAAYKLILDRQVGQHRLHERVAIGCAGNLMTDRAITNTLSTAMQSRLIHLEMVINHKQWLEDVALAENYDERVIAYLAFDENELMNFRADHQDKSFNCPRTWGFMNNLVKGKDVTEKKTPLYAGTISSGSAATFVQFCQIFKELVTIREVLADPVNAPVPTNDVQRCYAITTHLMGKVDDKNFDDIATYINRFDLTFKILFFRGMMVRHPKLRSHPAFAKAMVALARYLKED